MWLLLVIAAVIVATAIFGIIGLIRLRRGSLGVTLQQPRTATPQPELPRPRRPAESTAIDAPPQPRPPQDRDPAGWWTDSRLAPPGESPPAAVRRPTTDPEIEDQKITEQKIKESKPTEPKLTEKKPTEKKPTDPTMPRRSSLESLTPSRLDDERARTREYEPFSWDQSW